jgi:hypothetical protein
MATMFIGPMFCQHGRTPEHCEDCRIALAYERGQYVPIPVKSDPPPELEIAERDLYIDHGDDRYVYVAAGDPIPHQMKDLPRVMRRTPQAGEDKDKPARSGMSAASRS